MSVHRIFILSILFSLNHKNLFKFIFCVISPVKYEEVRGEWKRFIIGTIVLDSLLQCKILKAQELKTGQLFKVDSFRVFIVISAVIKSTEHSSALQLRRTNFRLKKVLLIIYKKLRH